MSSGKENTLPENFGDILGSLMGDKAKQAYEQSFAHTLSRDFNTKSSSYYNSLEIGTHYKGEGVCIGLWEPKVEGISLSRKFDVYAASSDIAGDRTFADTLEVIKKINVVINDVNGTYEGLTAKAYECREELIEAIFDGSYKGEWFIPVPELMTVNSFADAKMEQGEMVFGGTLFDVRRCGRLKDTFSNLKPYLVLPAEKEDHIKGQLLCSMKNGILAINQNGAANKYPTRLVRAVERKMQ